MKKLPHLTHEKKLWKKGYTVIGIDEVGRGAFAGPLVVGAVVFEKLKIKNEKLKIEEIGINDSKKLSRAKREELAKIIKKHARHTAVVSIPVSIINKHGIGKSTHIAMRRIVKHLRSKIRHPRLYLLIDAFSIKYIRGVGLNNQKGIIKGDCISLSIASASIIAKVHRDNYMKKLAKKYPEYGFEKHVGYGTSEHRASIKKHGASEVHRKDFIKKTLHL